MNSFDLRKSLQTMICFALLMASAQTYGSDWTRLKSSEKFGKICTTAHPCQVEAHGKVYNIEFTVATEDDFKVIDGVEVWRRVSTGIHQESSRQSFEIKGMNQIAGKEYFEIYQIDGLMPGRTGDFAIHTTNSPKSGPVYIYFLYDEVTQKFVQSKGPYPKLQFDSKSQQLVTDTTDNVYEVGRNLQISNFYPVKKLASPARFNSAVAEH